MTVRKFMDSSGTTEMWSKVKDYVSDHAGGGKSLEFLPSTSIDASGNFSLYYNYTDDTLIVTDPDPLKNAVTASFPKAKLLSPTSGFDSNLNKTESFYFSELEYISGMNSIFKNDSTLTTFIAPKLKNIPNNAFDNCMNLSNYDFTGVLTIGANAFHGCLELGTDSEITFPNLKYLDLTAFRYTSITTFNFPELRSVRGRATTTQYLSSAASYSYTYSSAYTPIKYFNTPKLEYVPDSAFINCSTLISIDYTNVSYIGVNAFYNCSMLSEYLIAPNLTSHGGFCFSCRTYKNMYVPSSMATVTHTGLKYISVPKLETISGLFSTITETSYNFNYGGVVSLTIGVSNHIGYNPASLSILEYYSNALLIEDNGALSSIANHLKTLYAPMYSLMTLNFVGNTKIEDVTLGISEMLSFSGATHLKSYNFSQVDFTSFTSIPIYMFYNCNSLSFVSFPNASIVYDYAFTNCGLSSLTISTVNYIGTWAFSGCTHLSDYSFLNYNIFTSIPTGAFNRCGLVSASFPEVSYIGNSAFQGAAISSISLPKLTSMGGSVFYGCVNLSYICLSLITTLPYGTFYGCYNLESVSLPEVTSMGGSSVFRNCSKLSYIELPKLSLVSTSAFAYHSNITAISLPEVSRIYSSAFYSCTNLTTVTLSKINSMSSSVFYYCVKLSLVDLTGTSSVPYIPNSGVFSYCSALAEIRVPASLYAAYIAHASWKYLSGKIVSV